MKSLTLAAVFSVSALLCAVVLGDFYSSISDLEKLLHTEGELAKEINKYVQKEEQRIEKIKQFGSVFQKLYDSASENPEAFLSHPVHAYLLVKHLSSDWKYTLALVDNSQKLISDWMDIISRRDLMFPGEEDLKGAALALIRLQETYLLSTTDIARGEVGGTTESFQLSAGDCYELGFHACEDNEHEFCHLWMQETLAKLETESVPTANRLRVMEMIAVSGYAIGKVEEAKHVNLKIIEENPNHQDAQEFAQMFDQYLKEMAAGGKTNKGKQRKSSRYMAARSGSYGYLYDLYEKLCRDEEYEERRSQGPLHCRYTSRNNSFLLLQPVKEEELSLDPRIVVYHDVMSDRDMDVLKQLAKPELKRARVHNPALGAPRVSRDRVSKSTWFSDSDHPVVARSSRMAQALAGLSITTAETLHVINYGIGGHYEPHTDFSTVQFAFSKKEDIGNRIATLIYYLSDVEAGGYTVFPTIGVQVKPRKGSAAFWFNLRRSGQGDLNTIHAACPVLIGSKWVANKWFHEADNEFIRKCTLNMED